MRNLRELLRLGIGAQQHGDSINEENSGYDYHPATMVIPYYASKSCDAGGGRVGLGLLLGETGQGLRRKRRGTAFGLV